jgi:hypothetical protein
VEKEMRNGTVILLMLLLAACAASSSGYQKNYQASKEVASEIGVEWLAEGARPRIILTEDLGTELEARRSEGYLVVGYSQFSGPLEGDDGLVAQARASRATLVIKSVLEEGKMRRYRRVYDPGDGVVYVPVVAEQGPSDANTEAGDVPDEPGYEKVTVYRQTALFLARQK